jgi:hypothetical protein
MRAAAIVSHLYVSHLEAGAGIGVLVERRRRVHESDIRRFIEIVDVDGEHRRGGIRSAPDRRVVHGHLNRVGALALEIEHAGLQPQLATDDLEEGGVGANEAKRVRAEIVVGHLDIGDLDPRAGVGVLIDRGRGVGKSDRRRRIIHRGHIDRRLRPVAGEEEDIGHNNADSAGIRAGVVRRAVEHNLLQRRFVVGGARLPDQGNGDLAGFRGVDRPAYTGGQRA